MLNHPEIVALANKRRKLYNKIHSFRASLPWYKRILLRIDCEFALSNIERRKWRGYMKWFRDIEDRRVLEAGSKHWSD